MNETYQKNVHLDLPNVKNAILKYLYSRVNLDVQINPVRKTDLCNIKNNDYIICPRVNGVRSWIIFCKIDDCYYATNFPKHNQRKKQQLVIHPIDIQVGISFYSGTIMEGIFFQTDDSKFLIIDEVYILAGENQKLKPKDDRLTQLSRYLTENIILNPAYQMHVSQFYQIDRKNLLKLFDKIKSDQSIQEIIFYPKITGKPVYSYTIVSDDLIENVVKISLFKMQSTKNPDVYNLYHIGNNVKVGIAYIPDTKTSKICKKWFKETKNSELFVKCRYNEEKKKWLPFELIDEDVLLPDNDNREHIEV